MNTTKTPSQLADDARQTANEAVESTRAYAQNAVNAAGEKVRELRRDAEPAVEQLAARAQRRIGQAADVTGRYISDQPVRSVLIAAAAGAAITALIVLASRRSRDDY